MVVVVLLMYGASVLVAVTKHNPESQDKPSQHPVMLYGEVPINPLLVLQSIEEPAQVTGSIDSGVVSMAVLVELGPRDSLRATVVLVALAVIVSDMMSPTRVALVTEVSDVISAVDVVLENDGSGVVSIAVVLLVVTGSGVVSTMKVVLVMTGASVEVVMTPKSGVLVSAGVQDSIVRSQAYPEQQSGSPVIIPPPQAWKEPAQTDCVDVTGGVVVIGLSEVVVELATGVGVAELQ